MLDSEQFAKDLDVVARTVYGEARGEPWLGKVAVAWVIRNRVEVDLNDDDKPDWWGEGYIPISKHPWQFSCWNEKDPNRELLEKIDVSTSSVFRECVAAASMVMLGMIPDPTFRSFHYINPKYARAEWFVGKQHCFSVGKHIFFNNVK